MVIGNNVMATKMAMAKAAAMKTSVSMTVKMTQNSRQATTAQQ